jgi:hypothetical protein
MLKVLSLFGALFHFLPGIAQTTPPAKLKVFIDCRGGCDINFLKTEINILDFVIDRTAADVDVLVTSQPTGAGGNKYQLNFYGQNAYQNYIDTIYFTTKPNATAAKVRESLLQYLMLGFAPLIATTPYAPDVKISMKVKKGERDDEVASTTDKWNYWVYNVGVNGQFNADQVYNTAIVSSTISATRITNKLKVHFSGDGSLYNTGYSYPSGDTSISYNVKNTDYNFYHYLVKSITNHWSVGYQVSFSNSTFANIKRKLYFKPSIEYNFYNFKDVNNKFLVVRYGLDISNYHYYDTTIFDKIAEARYGQKLSVTLSLNKKWGTINTGAYYRNFLKDGKLNSMGINSNADVKITGALSFYVNIDAGMAHDQINLVKSGATEQEVLTRKRQVASNFHYNTSFGVNFRFGSILNNFVNPRFDGYGGF